jgi:hypothetical protein
LSLLVYYVDLVDLVKGIGKDSILQHFYNFEFWVVNFELIKQEMPCAFNHSLSTLRTAPPRQPQGLNFFI